MTARKRYWTRKVMIRGEIVWIVVSKHGPMPSGRSWARDDQAGALEYAAELNALAAAPAAQLATA